jgi:hypothetical protein
VNDTGHAISVWQQFDGTRTNTWANRYVPGMGWETATLIETNDGPAGSPQVAVDGMGQAIALYSQRDGLGVLDIWAKRFVPGVGWGGTARIEAGTGDAVAPQIAMDDTGHAIAVWYQYQSDGSASEIWANRYVPGAGWGTAVLIETSNTMGDARDPQVAMDDRGYAIAVWHHPRGVGAPSTVWANRYVPGTGWGTATPIETSSRPTEAPQVAMDSTGHAVAVWSQIDGPSNNANIWANRYVPGTGWETATLIETDDVGPATAPQVAMDSTGHAVAVWSQLDRDRLDRTPDNSWGNIWANRYVPGTGWGTATVIETDNSGTANTPQVEMNGSGQALAVWSQSDGTRDNIWANRYVPGAGWDTAAPIEIENVGDAVNPEVAINDTGQAMAVWLQSDGTRDNVWANRYDMN